MRALIGAVVVLAFAGFTAAQDKDKDKIDLKKLMGKWELKENGLDIEFADKGKLIITINASDKSSKIEGTYKAEGNKINVVVPVDGKDEKQSLTIKKLTDDELITTDEKGKDATMKKKK